jgi:6-phosphogluconolactonase (cycloisomerase 2 family)
MSIGANVGSVDGMKVTPDGKYLIVAYGDASIGSYAIDSKTGALTLVSRYLVTDSGLATGVDITSDGKWALFGAVAFGTGGEVEVAPIHADGSLGATIGYIPIGQGGNSNDAWLSPDETYVYIGDNSSGQITAVPFDAQTGVIKTSAACTSAVLRSFNYT